jgi:hypothetical protein
MSDLVKRMKATLGMNVISPGSSADEYRVAAWQFAEAMDRIAELEEENKRLQNGLDWEAKYPVHEELRKCNEYNRKLEARLVAMEKEDTDES